MLKSPFKVLAALLFVILCAKIWACSFAPPITWLDNGGQAAIQAPEFFWEIECKRIAREFVPPERYVGVPPSGEYDPDPLGSIQKLTAKKDEEDFSAAVKGGYLKTADADAALRSHTEARDALEYPSVATKSLHTLLKEVDSEFSDYHNGALAFHAEDFTAAKTAWEALLKRPGAERKYRSTWAAYMLGRVAMQEKDPANAVKFFQMTRQLAKDGFADSLGLAAASYGWEASVAESAGDLGKAARLYLTQLGAGDLSAVFSLKSMVPDLPSDPSGASPEYVEASKANQKRFDEAVKDPLLRRLITAKVLCNIEAPSPWDDDDRKPDTSAQTLWLGVLEKLGVKDNVDAENLGWIAYTAGKYDEAARWLKLSSGKTPAAHWLKAKLALRHGNTAAAAAALSEAVHGLQKLELPEDTVYDGPSELPYARTRGDLGMVLVTRGDFIQALDLFLEADLWFDAAYVAERCLTTKELLTYAAKHFDAKKAAAFQAKEGEPMSEEENRAGEHCVRFRDLVARRLVREGNYKEARRWFAASMLPVLEEYTAALAKGNNPKTPKPERARALFHAAWIARDQGMELMGTEDGPDNSGGFGNGGGDAAMERLTGKPHEIEDHEKSEGELERPAKLISFALPVSAAEKVRLAATRTSPELRFHYRHVAAGLAWKAAALMPDGAEETADVLNAAGSWLKAKHEKQADRFYQAIERRCPNTEIGKEAVRKHWFAHQEGSWSAEETARAAELEGKVRQILNEEAEKRGTERAAAMGKENEAK